MMFLMRLLPVAFTIVLLLSSSLLTVSAVRDIRQRLSSSGRLERSPSFVSNQTYYTAYEDAFDDDSDDAQSPLLEHSADLEPVPSPSRVSTIVRIAADKSIALFMAFMALVLFLITMFCSAIGSSISGVYRSVRSVFRWIWDNRAELLIGSCLIGAAGGIVIGGGSLVVVDYGGLQLYHSYCENQIPNVPAHALSSYFMTQKIVQTPPAHPTNFPSVQNYHIVNAKDAEVPAHDVEAIGPHIYRIMSPSQNKTLGQLESIPRSLLFNKQVNELKMVDGQTIRISLSPMWYLEIDGFSNQRIVSKNGFPILNWYKRDTLIDSETGEVIGSFFSMDSVPVSYRLCVVNADRDNQRLLLVASAAIASH